MKSSHQEKEKKLSLSISPRENYFESAGQNVRQAFNALPDILIPCRTFVSVDDRQFISLLSDIFRALNSAEQNVRQWWNPLPDISRNLPDMSSMSGIFREDCSIIPGSEITAN